jgi:glycosyltransferase involved in cell wall biosynthesis
MRILFLNHNVAWSGGTFFRAFGFARALAAMGHEVTQLSISPDARFTLVRECREGVDLWQTPDLFWGRGRTGWDPWDAWRRVLALRSGRWDIVHAWDSRPVVVLPALYAAHRSRPSGGRLVMDWCDWWGRGGSQAERSSAWMRVVAPVETFFEERFRSEADGTTVISDALRERAEGLGVNPHRILKLVQGCDVRLGVSTEREAALKRLGLSSHSRLAIAVGALNRSDAQLLFDAVRLLLQGDDECEFAVVGKRSGLVPPDLRGHRRFREVGFVPAETLTDYVEASALLLAPLADTTASRARWPSKINGFLSAGRAVVTTRVGDLPALLEREHAAAVAAPDPGDVAAVAIHLLRDEERRHRIGSQGRRVAETLLAWDVVARDLEAFYRDIARQPAIVG